MPTVEEVARQARAAIDSDLDLVIIGQWVSDSFRQAASIVRLRGLRQLGTITTKAPVTAGLATATNGSNVVTGDATAQAAWDSTLVGMHFRSAVNWYEIQSVTSTPTLVLTSDYTEETVTAGGYEIVERVIVLPKEVRHLTTVVHPRLHRVLNRISLTELNTRFPARTFVGVGPQWYAESYRQHDAQKRIETYPASSQAETLYYTFWEEPPVLQGEDEIPGDIDAHALVEGTLMRMYRHMSAEAAKKGNIEEAALWRNEWRAQNTTWRTQTMNEITRSDATGSDVTFVIEQAGLNFGEFDIFNAEQHIWSGPQS